MRTLFGWAAAALLVVFVLFNFDRAEVWFFGIRARMPLGLMVILAAVLGAAASWGLGRARKGRR